MATCRNTWPGMVLPSRSIGRPVQGLTALGGPSGYIADGPLIHPNRNITMQVTNVTDHVTHANISGAKAIDFGISDSAEFFNILSSTLYSDQILAVVRETLCNAWDAHIEFGCTDKPVEIKLSKEELTIRDHGPGIPQNMMGPIYGTYGGSTKSANGQVTGGFGLGCKAPFAYTDYFDVTSWSKADGKMTIYSLSKSNAEVQGKPSILPVVSVPTIEHGLEVKIMLKKPADMERFKELIKRIAKNGQMNMTLNGEKLEVLPFDTMVHDFMLTRTKVLETGHAVLLRYGNVIYPIEDDEKFAAQNAALRSLLQRLPQGPYNTPWKIIFQAKPNTISVTPSREALSMQKHTTDAIKELLTDFLKLKDKLLHAQCFELLRNNIENTYLNSTPKDLFKIEESVPNLYRGKYTVLSSGRIHFGGSTDSDNVAENVVDFPQIVREYTKYSYPDLKGYRKKDILHRLNALIQTGHGNKRAIKALRTEFLRMWGGHTKTTKSSWLTKEVIYPIIKGMTEDKGVRADKLFIYGTLNQDRWGQRELGFHSWKKFPQRKPHEYLPFLRNHVILSFNRQDIDRAKSFPVMQYWLGEVKDSLVYIVPRAERKVKAAREYFEGLGMHVVDLTTAQQWEDSQAAQPVVSIYPPKPRKQGIPLISNFTKTTDENNKELNVNRAFKDGADLTKDPEFVVKFSQRNAIETLDDISVTSTIYIANKWGDKGAIAVNQNQFDRYIKQGAISMQDYVLDRMLETFKTSQTMINSLKYAYELHKDFSDKWRHSHNGFDWMPIIWSDKDLREYFGIFDNRTSDDMAIMALFKEFKSNYWQGSQNQRKEIETIISGSTLDPSIDDMLRRIKMSKTLQIFENEGLSNIMMRPKLYQISVKQRELVRDMLVNALEN